MPHVETSMNPKSEPKTTQVFSKLVAPLQDAYDRMSPSESQRLHEMDELQACVTLLEKAATARGQKGLCRNLRTFVAHDAALAAAGGIIGPSELSRKLGKSRQTLKDWGDRYKVLWVNDHGLRSYPLCQFDHHGQILAGLDRFLRTLAESGITGWMALDALIDADPRLGISPLKLLECGRTDEAVMCAVARTESGAA